VVKAALVAASGFIAAIATILVAAGSNAISDETTRYALTVAGVISVVALFPAALYLFRRK
jgi:hypothetical protein